MSTVAKGSAYILNKTTGEYVKLGGVAKLEINIKKKSNNNVTKGRSNGKVKPTDKA